MREIGFPYFVDLEQSMEFNKDKIIVIYGLICPTEKIVRYVGKSSQIEERYKQHLFTYENTHKDNWIKKLKKLNMKPKFIILEYAPNNWINREKWWIEYFKDRSNKLTNISPGGYGPNSCSQETRKKISESNMGRVGVFLGKKHSQKAKDKMSQVHSGKKLSKETREKIRIASTGRRHTKETRAKISKASTGRKISKKIRAKMSKVAKSIAKYGVENMHYGKKRSEETKAKMSKARKAYYRQKKIIGVEQC